MGEDNKPCTAYMTTDTGERVPVIMDKLPEIKMDIDPERAARLVAFTSTIWPCVVLTVEAVAKGFTKWLQTAAEEVEAQHEMETALRWASVDNRKLYHRYHHTKKKRIRKKYAKRIMAWYREEIAP